MSNPPFRVVIVEDDDDVAVYVQTVLARRLGCQARVLPDPTTVVAVLREFSPDVVITDIQMPGGGGAAVLAATRAHDPALPVIAMTAHASVEYARKELGAEADHYLIKPLNSAQLVQTVGEVAQAYRGGSPVPST